MSKRPGIMLVQKNNDFVLRRTGAAGRTTSMTLSKEDILTLSQAIPSLRDHILAGQSLKGGTIEAVVMTDVARIGLNVDLHLSEIHLTMIDRHDARAGFALSLELAQQIAARLPARVAEIAEAAKTRIRQ